MWAHLEDAVREGSPRWTQTFGWQGSDLRPFLPHRRPPARDFLRGMHGFGQLSSPAVVAAFDLCAVPSSGRPAAGRPDTWRSPPANAIRNFALRYSIFRAVMDMAQEYAAASPARGRIEVVAGDFFRDELPPGDLYALGRILHDWPEERIRLLLHKVFRSLPAGGALLIAEKLVEEDRSGPVAALMQSMNMLVCTEGRERTLGEYTALLREAGFAKIEGKRSGAPLDAILAVRGN